MVAYSFQKRFIGPVLAGLEPGPWLPDMKRHTLRLPREGRSKHVRPEQPVHLYTAMRTKHCRQLGLATCRLRIPVRLVLDCGKMSIARQEGAALRSYVKQLAPIVQQILEAPVAHCFEGDAMDEFARTDGFADREEMAAFFNAPKEGVWHLQLVLIAWAPGYTL